MVIAKTRAAGHSIYEVPVRHYPRRAGQATGAEVRVIAHALLETWELSADLRSSRSATRVGPR